MTALQELLLEFYDRADITQELITYAMANELKLDRGRLSTGIMAMCPVSWSDHRFEFADDGEPTIVCEAIAEDDETVVDLVAWPVARPERFAPALGIADGLGVTQVENPATYFGGRALRLHRTPLSWLRSGCDGAVIVNRTAAPRWLGGALGQIAVEDVEHGREVARLLHPYFTPRRILVPSLEREGP